MKIQAPKDPTNVATFEELRRITSQALQDIYHVVNGQVDLKDNCTTAIVTVPIAKANQDVQVTHRLGRIPTGYIVIGNAGNQTVYDGTTSPTSTTLTLRATGTFTVKVLVF